MSYAVDGEDQLSLLLIALAIVGLLTTWVLVRGAHRTGWPALVERAGLSIGLSCFRLILAALSVLHLFRIDTDPHIIGTVIVVLFIFIGVIDVIWGLRYWRGGFD